MKFILLINNFKLTDQNMQICMLILIHNIIL